MKKTLVFLTILVHLAVVGFFFSSPWLPFWWQIAFLAAGILTLPIRNKYFDGKCPFTKWERDARTKAGDRKHKIHTNTFMETYFHIPDARFKIIEKGLMILLLTTIVTQIVLGQTLWKLILL